MRSGLKILLIRHAQSQGNVEGRMEGWQSTGLTPQGQQQAQQLGGWLGQHQWHPTHIYCSPLLRATETLAAMSQGFEAAYRSGAFRRPDAVTDPLPQPQCWDDLKENNQGIFNGLTWPEAQARYPDLCDRLESSLDWVPIPGAETLAAGRDRARRVVDQLLHHRNGDRLWVISHQWILQQIVAELLGCERVWGISIGHTARFEVWLDRDRWANADQRLNSELWQIKAFNDSSHLAPGILDGDRDP